MQAEEPCAPRAPRSPDARQRGQRARNPELRLSGQLLPELYGFVARVLFYLAPVYLAGYLGLSVTWLLLGALLWMWWRRNRRGKLGRLEAAFEFLEHEREFISRELRGQHLPAWVSLVGWRAVGFGGGAGGRGIPGLLVRARRHQRRVWGGPHPGVKNRASRTPQSYWETEGASFTRLLI